MLEDAENRHSKIQKRMVTNIIKKSVIKTNPQNSGSINTTSDIARRTLIISAIQHIQITDNKLGKIFFISNFCSPILFYRCIIFQPSKRMWGYGRGSLNTKTYENVIGRGDPAASHLSRISPPRDRVTLGRAEVKRRYGRLPVESSILKKGGI